MAKSILKLKARKMRQDGESIRAIASTLVLPKSTISLWCRDIELSKQQIAKLLVNKENGMRLGQINGALIQKKRRLHKIAMYEKEGIERMKKMSEADFFTAGLALYLGEGTKKNRRIEFINSDPRVIKFMVQWFEKFFSVKRADFTASVVINDSHMERENTVNKFWAHYLDFKPEQFRKMVFVKSRQKKVYENHHNYFGTFRFRILKSTDLCYKILGLIGGLLGFQVREENKLA
jgi:tRNA G10  N-methylase Trm11